MIPGYFLSDSCGSSSIPCSTIALVRILIYRFGRLLIRRYLFISFPNPDAFLGHQGSIQQSALVAWAIPEIWFDMESPRNQRKLSSST